jgi:mycothiol synthase
MTDNGAFVWRPIEPGDVAAWAVLLAALVGTRRAGRNRGIASALLSRALADGKAAGFGTSSLVVDADSLTGAVGLYKRIGYTVERTGISQSKQLTTPAG